MVDLAIRLYAILVIWIFIYKAKLIYNRYDAKFNWVNKVIQRVVSALFANFKITPFFAQSKIWQNFIGSQFLLKIFIILHKEFKEIKDWTTTNEALELLHKFLFVYNLHMNFQFMLSRRRFFLVWDFCFVKILENTFLVKLQNPGKK